MSKPPRHRTERKAKPDDASKALPSQASPHLHLSDRGEACPSLPNPRSTAPQLGLASQLGLDTDSRARNTITPANFTQNPPQSGMHTHSQQRFGTTTPSSAPGNNAPSASHPGSSSSTYWGAERANEYVENVPSQVSHYSYRSDQLGGAPHPSLHNTIFGNSHSAATQSAALRQLDPTMDLRSSSAAQSIRASLPSDSSSFQQAPMRDVPSRNLGGSLAAGTSTTPHSASTSTYRGTERVPHRPEDIPSHASYMYRPDQGEASHTRQDPGQMLGNTWSMATPPEVPGQLGPAIELQFSSPAQIHRRRSGTITASSASPNLPPGSSSANMAFQPAQTGSIPGWKSGSSFAGPSHQSGPSSSIRGPDLGIGREEEHDSKREATPEVGSQESSDKVYQSTPNSNHSNSYAPAVPPGKTYRVDEVNKYLEADFTFIRKLPVEEFAKLTMNLDVNKDDWTLSDSVETAFKNYLDVVASAANEDDKRVYPALVQLLNALPNDNITFYCQDPKMIQGSLVLESPDVCGVFKKLAEGGDIHDKEGRVVLWGHLATIVECKVKKGKMVEPDFGVAIDTNDKPNEVAAFDRAPKAGQKRSREEDATAQEERPQKKTLLRPPIIEIEHSSGSWGYTIDPSTGRVIGTVPKRMSPKGARIQKMGYARDILCWGVLRTHVYIVLIDCHLARITYYDHSVIIESGLLDLTKPSGKLNFAKMVKRLRSMSSEELGLARGMDAGLLTNPLTLQVPKDKKTKTTEPPSSRLYELDGDSFFTFPYDIDSPGAGQTRIVKLGRVLARSNGVLGRGTTVVRVECACRRNLCCREGCNWAKKKLVMKLLFPGTSRVSEHVFMEECKKLATGDHAWVLNHLPEIYCSFDIAFTDESPQQRLSNALGNTYQMRIVRGMIQEELDPLSSLKTARECAQVFYDVVQCHHWVWKYPKILHRDISQGNIMVRVKDGVTYGVLNDWDLASWVGRLEQGPTSQFRTGTKPYMAHEQQRSKWKGPHRYRHDLESVFYVMTLFTFLYSTPSEKVLDALDEDYQFEKWHQEDDKFLAKTKFNLIGEPDWDPPVTQFFTGFKWWLIQLQELFSKGFQKQLEVHRAQKVSKDLRQRVWSRSQPQIQQTQSFDEETLDGFITCEYIALVVHKFEGEELDTRGAEWQELLRRG